jgi:hypothetical protein
MDQSRRFLGESPSGKALDFDSSIRRFDPYLPSQFSSLKIQGSVKQMLRGVACVLQFPV